MLKKINIAVLASGKGTNFFALAKAIKTQKLKAEIKLLITDKKEALVRKKARQMGIQDIFIDPKKFKSRLAFDKEIIKILKKEKIKLIMLAGYMRIISPFFVKSFKQKILNIHPALLPAFRGTNAISRAFRSGCKTTGVTVHFVDELIDHGPIISQKAIKITRGMSEANLERKIHKLEHRLYPLTLKLVLEKRVMVRNKNVKII